MKKIFLTLIIGFIGLLSFSDAGELTTQVQTFEGNTTKNYSSGDCIRFQIASNFRIAENGNTITLNNNNSMYCFTSDGTATNITSNGYNYYEYNLTDYISNFAGTDYTSEECQQEYSLMPIDSCNSEYCEMNNLCTGSNNTNWSLLYINDVLHESAPIINVRIPEEIQRDYTGNLEQFDLDVKGYGYDQDKMQQMVNTQRMTPDGEEMSKLIAKIADFLPLIAIALLIIWIRRVVKKVFKF